MEAAQDFARAATADNTLRAYRRQWLAFEAWCSARGQDSSTPPPKARRLKSGPVGSSPSTEVPFSTGARVDESGGLGVAPVKPDRFYVGLKVLR